MFRRRSSRPCRSNRTFLSSLNPFSRPVDRAMEWKRGYSRRLGLEMLEDRRMLSVSTFTPPFSGGDSGHWVHELGVSTIGIASSAESGSNGSVDLTSGTLQHNNWASTLAGPVASFSKVGSLSYDSISHDFTVPTDGTYDVTFSGDVDGSGYIISSGAGVGTGGLGAAKVWLTSQIVGMPGGIEETIYETDLSVGAFLTDVTVSGVAAALGVGDVVGALGTLASVASPEVEWNNYHFEHTVQATLEAGQTYEWAFLPVSRVASSSIAAVGIGGSNLTLFDLDVDLEEVSINPAADLARVPGVTIITHGFQSSADTWIAGMADAIAGLDDFSGVSQYRLQIDDDSGPIEVADFALIAGSPAYGSPGNTTGQAIIRVDWSDLDGGSRTPTGDVADVLAEYLLSTPINGQSILEAPIHLIGHSRGASLNTTLAERLGERGIWVDQFTTLDPRPVDGFGDAPINLWDNVRFGDNYWRQDSNVFDFNGESVSGAYNAELDFGNYEEHISEFVLSDIDPFDKGYGLEHLDTHLWYHGTIDTLGDFTDGERTIQSDTDWYDPVTGMPGPRDQTGYDYSLNRGGNRSTTASEGLATSSNRVAVNRAGAQWANIESLNIGEDLIAIGDPLHVDFNYQAVEDASVIIGYDIDRNPYNGVTGLSSSTLNPTSNGTSFDNGLDVSQLVDTSNAETGVFYPFARIISADGFSRHVYAGNTLTIVQADISPDSFEPNDSIAMASVLGSLPFATVQDLSIHDDADRDFFRYTANQTGKLIVNVLFADEQGDLDLRVVDSEGNIIASSASVTNDEQVVIPVVSQESYFIEVYGFLGDTNSYSLEIENFAAPMPSYIDLAPYSDTGMLNNDDVTSDRTPTLMIQADLAGFQNSGITLLDQATIDPNNDGNASDANNDGAGVYVSLINLSDGSQIEGFANSIGSSGILWSFTPSSNLSDGDYFVSTAVQIVDGQQDPNRETGREQLSNPFWMTIDTTPPTADAPDLLASSDTSLSSTDNITSINTPAFAGLAGPNAKVRIYAQNVATGVNELVGQSVANYDGTWEITIEPLADSTYDMTVRIEDAAGNLSDASDPLRITIDTVSPQRPTIDLPNSDDTGVSDLDNVTIGDPSQGNGIVDVRISGELGSTIVIKDGQVVVDTFVFDAAFDLTDGVADNFGIRTINFNANQTTFNIPAQGPHPLSAEAFDAAGNFTQSEQQLVTIDFTAPATPDAPNLLASSDTGMFDDDNVTNKMSPAFNGTGEANAQVRVFATDIATGTTQLIGESVVGSDESDGNSNNGLGTWEVTAEPIADGEYDITVEFEDLAGNVSDRSASLRIWIDTAVPNTPLLDLNEASDTGRNDTDDITSDNTPTFLLVGNDTVGGNGNPFPNDLKYRLYDRPGNGSGEVLIFDSFATFAGFVTFGQISFTSGVLDDGVHNLKLEVEDRAGNISPDFLLTIVVDTVDPPVSFGLPDAASTIDGLDAASDTGVVTMPATFADRITSDTTPSFWGRAEADSIVQLFLDTNTNGVIDLGTDVFLGGTVALPFDGNDAFPDGFWEIDSSLDLNQLVGLPKDSMRRLLVTAEDVAGNPMVLADATVDQLDVFLDTQGPQVNDVFITDVPDYDLFDPKPLENGPTPLVSSITIDFIDQPNRVAPDFVYDALRNDIAASPGNYLLVGDHLGTIAIDTVVVVASSVADGAPSATSIALTFVDPLPDDRFTLTILDNLVDPAGNRLDGESNANEPLEDPAFPGGDGVPGGDFVARFTIDTRPEVGSYVSAGINLDINGNFVWDPASGQIGDDATNVDLTFTLPVANPDDGSIDLGGFGVHDLLFAGKFAPQGGLIVGDDAVFIVDVSGSTGGGFGGDPVGDQNNDGSFNTIIDAEIAAFKALNQELIDRGLGNTSQVAIVAFASAANTLDMNPVLGGVQLTTTPLADANSNGMRDVDEILMGLIHGGGTNYEAALTVATTAVNTIASPNTNVIFLSDGAPNFPGAHAGEAAVLQGLGTNLRAFGVGPAVPLAQLLIIDPNAETFANTNELLNVFSGGGDVPDGSNSGFDQLAAYGNSAELGEFRWIIDTNSDGVVNPADGDIITLQPLQAGFNVAGAIPLAGNFDGNADNGDEIALYNFGTWVLDTDRDFVIETNGDDTTVVGTLLGHPIVGDFDGDGLDDLAVFNNNLFSFDLANDGFGTADANGDLDDTFVWGFPGVLDRPVATDMDQDGIDDIGLWVPRDRAQLPQGVAEWYFLLSNDFNGGNRITGMVNTLDHPFEPVPFGSDLYAEFGDKLSLPIVGNFDPPIASASQEPPIIPDVFSENGDFFSENGDFDRDGDFDGSDFLAWQRGYGMSNPDVNNGDADASDTVDEVDLSIWESQFGTISAPAVAAVAAASEPAAASFLESQTVAPAIEPLSAKSVVTAIALSEPVFVASSLESQAATDTPQLLSADLVDAVIAVDLASRSKSESRLGSPASLREEHFDELLRSARWSQPQVWQAPGEIGNHSPHNQVNNGRFYRDADDDIVNEELLDDLFADGEFISLF